MGCVLAILMTHEMGHFLMALLYRVRASLPYFIPLPISPIGTMGAVIAMDSRIANRKQIFDIGLAGPLAGLVVAVPIMWIGVQRMEFAPKGPDSLQLPLAMSLAVQAIHPTDYNPGDGFSFGAGQSVSHGRLGGPARDGPEHAAGQPARRRPRHLCSPRQESPLAGSRLHGRRPRLLALYVLLRTTFRPAGS